MKYDYLVVGAGLCGSTIAYELSKKGYKVLVIDKRNHIKIPEISVCEDVTEHYNYWKENINVNKDDCCNLRIKEVI